MNFSEKWAKEHTFITPDGRHAYIYVKLTDVIYSQADPKSWLKTQKRHVFKDEEKKLLSFEMKVKFVRALGNCENNIPRMYILLDQVFTAEAIKLFFFDIWRSWNNVMTRKQNNRERTLKLNKDNRSDDRKEVERITSNCSIRQAARENRNFV